MTITKMRRALLATTLLAVAACDLSPDYTLPEIRMGDTYQEAAAEPVDSSEWVAPADDVKWRRVDEKAQIEEVAWWRMLNLPELDALEEQAMKDNPSLEVAAQRLRAAEGAAQIADSDLYPSIGLGFGPQRLKPADANINATLPPGFVVRTKPYTVYTTQGTISYTLDLFGKNRNIARAATEEAEAEANNYRAARLTLQAELAKAYIERTALLMEHDILARTVKARTASSRQTREKRDVGTVDDLTFANVEVERANAEADRNAVLQQLAVAEHRIAALVGVAPGQLKLGDAKLVSAPPSVPAGMPSKLLERRPDIQIAARQIAAANARVGAARAGYFPDISLSAIGGFTSTELSDMFKKSNRFWSVGPLTGGTMLTQPIFEGGLLSGTLKARKAEYQQASANYRGVVLDAFRDVEDNLSAIRNLNNQAKAREASVKAAQRGYRVATERYNIGYTSQLEYLDTERSLLATQRGAVQILGQRYIATVGLVQALGGSWDKAAAAKVADPAVEPMAAPAVDPKV